MGDLGGGELLRQLLRQLKLQVQGRQGWVGRLVLKVPSLGGGKDCVRLCCIWYAGMFPVLAAWVQMDPLPSAEEGAARSHLEGCQDGGGTPHRCTLAGAKHDGFPRQQTWIR